MSGPDDAMSSRPTISSRVAGLATYPGLPWVLAALGVLLVLPSLRAVYLLDDYLHQRTSTSPVKIPLRSMVDARSAKSGGDAPDPGPLALFGMSLILPQRWI